MSTVSSPFYTDEHEAFRDVIRQFTTKEITPHVHDWDGRATRVTPGANCSLGG